MPYVEKCLQCLCYYYEDFPKPKDLCGWCRKDIIIPTNSNERFDKQAYYYPSRGLMSAAKLTRKLQRTHPEITHEKCAIT